MTENRSAYANVEFRKRGGAYRGSVPLGDLPLLTGDPAATMSAVAALYQAAVADIGRWQADAKVLRQSRTPMPVIKAWELGNILHSLNVALAKHGCKIDKIYEHLERHAGLSSKRASSFVTLRRYVDNPAIIPPELQWNRILKTVKTTSQAIAEGLPVKDYYDGH